MLHSPCESDNSRIEDADGVKQLQLQLCNPSQLKRSLKTICSRCTIASHSQECAQGEAKGYKTASWPLSRPSSRACQPSHGPLILCVRASRDAMSQHELRRRCSQEVGIPDHVAFICAQVVRAGQPSSSELLSPCVCSGSHVPCTAILCSSVCCHEWITQQLGILWATFC